MLSKTWSAPTLKNSDFDRCFDMMLWATRLYGAAIKPPMPRALNPTPAPTHWEASDPDTVFEWAERSFAQIIAQMALEPLSICLVADARRADPQDSFARERLIVRSWQYGELPAYQLNSEQNPVVFYDPRKCDQPGYFIGEVLPKLASLKIASLPQPEGFVLTDIPALIEAVICHLGQGLSLSRIHVPDRPARALFVRSASEAEICANRYLYMTVIALSARRYSPEQIIASYGPALTKPMRKSIWPIYKRIEKADDCIKLLRIMTDRRLSHANKTIRSEHPAHNRPHQAQA